MIDQGDVTITNPGSGSGGSGSGSGGSVGTSPDPSPCVPVNVSTTKGGQKVNLVRPPDDGFPNPTDPAPCPTAPAKPTKPIKNYGMDQNCLNCRIEIVNFNQLVKDLNESGTHTVVGPFNGEVQSSNGKKFTGKLVEIYYTANGERRLLATYFTPAINNGPFQVGIYYAMGNGGPDGTSNTPTNGDSGIPPITAGNGIIILPSTPAITSEGNIFVYTRSGTTGTTAPSSTDVYTDPTTGITLKYADVENAFFNSPALAQIEAGEEVTSWPSPSMIIMNPIIGNVQTFYIEYEILKLNNPGWSTQKLAAVACWNTVKGEVHFMLDVAGMFPLFGEAADLTNAGIYYLEGDKINCAFSAAAAMPVVGWVATGGKWVKTVVKTVPIVNSIGKNGYRAIKIGKEVKLIKVAITTLNHASLKTLKAIKPADATLTNLNAYLINTFGLRISPTSTTLKNAINDIIKYGDQAGTKMEKLADDIFATNGYQKFNSKIGSNNGFDAVYIKGDLSNPTEIIINEAKQMSNVGTIKLNPATQGGKSAQMSEAWIDQTIEQMVIHSDSQIKNLGLALRKNRTLITKTVSAVDKSTQEIVILKLLGY
ncbi:hypothetical protein [Mucilaginibacter defluvii]|uniref:Uncharacterized protein n=1 Tax=Mucilaginibacter defluvii TaxID=1196019 RepID=A0ABP9G553_9SPHI